MAREWLVQRGDSRRSSPEQAALGADGAEAPLLGRHGRQVRNAAVVVACCLRVGPLPATSAPTTASLARGVPVRPHPSALLGTSALASSSSQPTFPRNETGFPAPEALIAMASIRSLLLGALASLPALAAATANASYPNADMLRAQLALIGDDRPDGCPPW